MHRCADQSEIWQGGTVRSSLPNFTLIGAKKTKNRPRVKLDVGN